MGSPDYFFQDVDSEEENHSLNLLVTFPVHELRTAIALNSQH